MWNETWPLTSLVRCLQRRPRMLHTTLGFGLVVFFGAVLGCADGGRASVDGTIDRVSTELSHGECGGYCRHITEIGADLRGRYRSLPLRDDPMYPPRERSFAIAAHEWAHVSELASIAGQRPWEPTYGCPDCADQGAWTLTVAATRGATRSTTLDTRPDQNPEPLQLVIDAVRGLHAEVR